MGANNYVFENRIIGAGFNSRMIQRYRTPGGPIIATVHPPSGARGTENLVIRITGANFKEGCQVEFGDGIAVIGEPRVISPTVMEVTVNIAPTARVGTRTVVLTNPGGDRTASKSGIFRVTSTDGPKPPPDPKSESAARPLWTFYD